MRKGYYLKIYFCGLLFFITTIQTSAQRSDLASWIYVEADTKIKSKFQTVFNLELRLKDDISKVDLYSGGVFGYYLFNPNFKMGLGYEYFANNTDKIRIKSEHRLLLQSNLQYPLGKFKFSWRASLLDTFYKFSDPNFGMRNRIKADYFFQNIHLKPFAYTELYHGFDHGVKHQKNRYAAGVHYLFKDNQQFDIYYMMEDYYSKEFTRHVIGLGYCISL